MQIAQVLHDRAAFPQHAFRQLIAFELRRQVRWVLGAKHLAARLAEHVLLVAIEAGGTHEHANRHIVHARRKYAEFHFSLLWMPARLSRLAHEV
jgi:hypothetical protein